MRPLTIAGLLLGMLAGWLLTAAIAYRARRGDRAHRAAVTLLGTGAPATAVLPAVALYHDLYRVMTYDVGNPHPYLFGGPNDPFPLRWTVVGLLVLAAAALAARRGARVGTPEVPAAS